MSYTQCLPWVARGSVPSDHASTVYDRLTTTWDVAKCHDRVSENLNHAMCFKISLRNNIHLFLCFLSRSTGMSIIKHNDKRILPFANGRMKTIEHLKQES